MTEELKPCAHCGGEAYRANLGAIRCKTCPAEMFARDVVAAWNRRADGWIPVSKRLPEPHIWIIATNSEGPTPAVYEPGCCHTPAKWFGAEGYALDGVTHWQPLPPPPGAPAPPRP